MMSNPLEQIQTDRDAFFQISKKDLSKALNSATPKEVGLFLETLTNQEWISGLKQDKSLLPIRVLQTIPKNTPLDKLQGLFTLIENLKIHPPQSFDDQREELICRKPELFFNLMKAEYIARYPSTDDDFILLKIISELLKKKAKVEPFFKLLLTKEIALNKKVDGLDLFDLGLNYGTKEQFLQIIGYYQKKMEESEFLQLINDRSESIAKIRKEEEATEVLNTILT